MRRLDEALSELVDSRRADGPDHLIDALRQRLAGGAEVIAPSVRTDVDLARTWMSWPGPLIAAGGLAAAVLLIAVPVLWLAGGDETTSAGEAPALTTTGAPATTATATMASTKPIVVPPATPLSSHLEPAPLLLGGEIGFARSGDTLWVWDGDGGVAGYRDGVWRALPPLPDNVRDIAGTMNGPTWAVTRRNLWYFEDDDWWSLPAEAAPPAELEFEYEHVEVDPATGILWVMNSAGLYRWDGVEMLQVASSSEMILEDFVVAGDGSIWSVRNNIYVPQADTLVRVDRRTGAWVSVRPPGDTDDLPSGIAITPEGNLWVGHANPEADPVDPTGFGLARLDTTSGEWVTYRFPLGTERDLVADDDVVWFYGAGSKIVRFNGKTAAMFSPGGLIDNIGLGNDGTLWVSMRDVSNPDESGSVYRLVIHEEATQRGDP
jgi:hypothetical protein